jgi:hypothetical protein
MNPLLPQIVDVLRSHVGRDQIISAQAIADQVGANHDGARLVREILSEALHDGSLERMEVPLCAIPGKGYFLAATAEEAQAYLNLLVALTAEAGRKMRAVARLFASLGIRLLIRRVRGSKA